MNGGNRHTWPRAARATVAGLLAVSVLATAAPPAAANHQNCGADYPGGSLSNGHPDSDWSAQSGWAGQVTLNGVEGGLFAATQVKETLLNAADVTTAVAEIIHEAYDTAPDEAEPFISVPEKATRAVAAVFVFSGLASFIAESALKVAHLAVAGAVNAENACNDVLGGDMLDQIWVSTVQRNLASDGPPLALLLTPTDSGDSGGSNGEFPIQPQHEQDDFTWCPEIKLPDELPEPAGETNLDEANGPETGGDCTPGYHDGFLDEPREGAPRVTVQAIVRDTIDHAKAHGLPVRGAEDHYDDAVAALGQERYKEAFQHFRKAYQAAAGFDG